MLIAVASDVLRNDVFRLVVGELIVSAGALAIVLHLVRPRSTDRSTLYFGLAAFLFGLRLILGMNALNSSFPSIPWRTIESSITLVIGLPFVFFLGSTLGRAYPWFTRAVALATVFVGLFGAVRLFLHASMSQAWFVNGIVIVASLAGWIYVGIFPKIPIDREVRALRIGLTVLGLFSLYQNLAVIGVFRFLDFLEPVGMLFLLGTFLYVSASRSLRQESKLLAIRNELEIAREIQAALLPQLAEALAGVEIHARYSPAGSVAGDFYDVLSDGQGLGVLIADVSGHGVPAALSASMLKVALRAQTQHRTNPAEVLAGLNRTLCGTLRDQFITAAYVYFDPAGQKLHYAGAGHPPILLWRAADGRVDSLEENGLFLGPFREAKYTAVSSPFEPGDRCLLYTDGLAEAENSKGEEFGSARLKVFLEKSGKMDVNSACTALLDRVTEWSGGALANQQDDITVVVVECKPVDVLALAEAPQGAFCWT